MKRLSLLQDITSAPAGFTTRCAECEEAIPPFDVAWVRCSNGHYVYHADQIEAAAVHVRDALAQGLSYRCCVYIFFPCPYHGDERPWAQWRFTTKGSRDKWSCEVCAVTGNVLDLALLLPLPGPDASPMDCTERLRCTVWPWCFDMCPRPSYARCCRDEVIHER